MTRRLSTKLSLDPGNIPMLDDRGRGSEWKNYLELQAEGQEDMASLQQTQSSRSDTRRRQRAPNNFTNSTVKEDDFVACTVRCPAKSH